MKQIRKTDLIELVRKIMDAEGIEEEIDAMIEILKQNVSHPQVSDLIFGNEDEWTPEQIVEQALSYKPIPL
ncbi:bacteriocin immunity protein [Paenibacillus odorifer]|uniref:bacteriocin immunity protein n=1 Tax=Paenibacillus odorifer TaxID=189426 RepID=UPI00096F73C7|nr:bacteriocin immunity protein [Paenibacillus odorifer]OME13790.1 hypothetical protein BSK57_29425 [Paenibacillus odorifer]